MIRIWLFLAGVFGASAIAMGAFAAHGLAATLSPEQLDWIETGAHYQLIHSLALMGVAWLSERQLSRLTNICGFLFSLGIVLFSGSLYLLPLTSALPVVISTPVGGSCFILGWLCLAGGAVTINSR